MYKKVAIGITLTIIATACKPSVCECVKAKRNEDGSYKDKRLQVACKELMNSKAKKLNNLSGKEREQYLQEHREAIRSCD